MKIKSAVAEKGSSKEDAAHSFFRISTRFNLCGIRK